MHRIIDLHCDTIMGLIDGTRDLATMEPAHINLEKLRKGGSLAQCFAIFIPRRSSIPFMEYFDVAYQRYQENMERFQDQIRPVYHMDDILANDKEGYLSSILTVEDGVNLDGKLENIDSMYEKGVRLITLTHNVENSLGYPNSAEEEKHALGLKPFGIEAVKRMNELGIAVDVSHLSEGGFWDCIRYSTKPIVASHSCARSLASHQRNLTDAQLKAIADKGGVVGINFYHLFLRDEEGDKVSRIDEVISHMKYIANLVGFDALALGSDYDGINSTLEWKDYAGYPTLLEKVEQAFGSANTEKIAWENAFRTLKECIG
ncbi:MAG: dipeptidase [Sphaerochaetaceae bacterium]|nr:dipeptidase [Sphaerochaetaceae bacterium]